MDYHVFKNGRSEGPFSEAQMVRALEVGEFSPGDLGQADGARHWVPLRSLFDVEMLPPEQHGVAQKLAHYRRTLGAVATQVRGVFERYPLETGLICLAAGCVVTVLSYVPILISGPWLLGALAAGGILMARGRTVIGLLMCIVAVFAPIVLWLLVSSLAARLWPR